MSDELQQMRIRLADDLQSGAYVSDPLLVVNAIEAFVRAIVKEEREKYRLVMVPRTNERVTEIDLVWEEVDQ